MSGRHLAQGTLSLRRCDGTDQRAPRSRASCGSGHTNPALTQSIGYDALDRLTSWASSTSNESFAYDATGNRVSQILGANTSTYTYPATSNRLSSISGTTARSYQYDAAGNTQTDGTRSFAYDARGRLIHSGSGALSADYQVNALGQRVLKAPSGAQASVFHYDRAGHLIAESDASGHPLKEYVWLADMPVAVLTTTPSTPACPAAPVSDSGGSFVAFSETEGLEVDVGEPDHDDLQWKLGSNTQARGQFVASSFDWSEHKSYRWTLSYDGKGSGTYTVFDGARKLVSRTFRGGTSTLLHTGNALRFMVRAGAHTRSGDVISVSITSVGSGAVSQTLATGSSGGASQQAAYFAGSSLAAGFSAEGTIEVHVKRHRHRHKHKLDMAFLVNAGNVSCSQSTQAKVDLAYIQPDHLDTPRTVTDSTQRVIWQWDTQDPFGANAPNEDPDGDGKRFTLNLRFPGQYFDSETGLHYNYFRDYDPQTGRYVQSDPVGLVGGINTYAYARGSAIGHSDPTGRNVAIGAELGAEGGFAVGGPVGAIVGAGLGALGGYLIADQVANVIFAKPGNESRPDNAPTGTRPIDEVGLGRDDVHDIKDGVGAGPRDYVGISPDGHVITSTPDGKAVDHGPADDYTRRPTRLCKPKR